MKKVIIVLISISLLLFSCNGETDLKENDTSSTPGTTTTTPSQDEQAKSNVAAPRVSFRGFNYYRSDEESVLSIYATDNATIYYCSSDKDPKVDGVKYWEDIRYIGSSTFCSGISIKNGSTINIVAKKDGEWSEVVTYTAPTEFVVKAPQLTNKGQIAGGTYIVSMYCNDPNAIICFTRDGSTPDASSLRYSTQIYTYNTIDNRIVSGVRAYEGNTIKAIAISTRFNQTTEVSTLVIE